MIKLHLGCGDKILDGFVNIDIREKKGVLIDDVAKLFSQKNNSISLIYACHVLEHFGRYEFQKVLKRWYSILIPGGILRLAVPDIEQACVYYLKYKNIEEVMGLFYGGQTYPSNYHYIGFDYKFLNNKLLETGFKSTRTWDWKTAEHSHVDDFSQAYLPHMNKENGTLMSLNIEAIK
jgi:predicted SAM-dependent methyltransferase